MEKTPILKENILGESHIYFTIFFPQEIKSGRCNCLSCLMWNQLSAVKFWF